MEFVAVHAVRTACRHLELHLVWRFTTSMNYLSKPPIIANCQTCQSAINRSYSVIAMLSELVDTILINSKQRCMRSYNSVQNSLVPCACMC